MHTKLTFNHFKLKHLVKVYYTSFVLTLEPTLNIISH